MGSKKIVTITSVVLLMTLVAASLVSNTFAKYTSNFSGSDTAVVANWDVSDGGALASFDIFDISKIYDTKDANYTAAGVDDDDVTNGTTNGIIAPGTWGKFSYTLSNNSDVNATYSVIYTVDEKNVPLKWSINGTEWTEDLANVTDEAIDMGTTDETITIYWKWDFAANGTQTDITDTVLGTAETLANPTVAVEVIFNQVD